MKTNPQPYRPGSVLGQLRLHRLWIAAAATAWLWAGPAIVAAESDSWHQRFMYASGADKYRANEFSLDLFGTWADRDRFGNDVAHGGGGLGVNYFFNKYGGIGADSYLEEWKAPYRANGSLFLRLPLGESGIAPYAFGGGGRQWKFVSQWTGHAGGGLELRLNPYTGLFIDGRRVFPDKTKDYTLARAGLRLAF